MIDQTNLSLSRWEFINAIRRNWSDRNQYIRALMRSITFSNPDRGIIEQRLQKTEADYATIFYNLYGEEIAESLRTSIAKFHQAITALIEAYRDDNIPAIEEKRSEMYDALDEMANTYSLIDPYIDRITIQLLLYEYGKNLEYQIARWTASDFEESFQAYDKTTDQVFRLADDIAYGIIRQTQQ